MAEETVAEQMNMSFEDNDRSKDADGDSDELSGQSFSDENNPRGDGSDGDDRKRKKRRRGRHKGGKHHRKWKPYTKLSWSERKAADARETQRANQKREDAFASGHPVAPYNTTQFLIDDHIQSEASPDLNHASSKQTAAQSAPTTPPPRPVPVAPPRTREEDAEDLATAMVQDHDGDFSNMGTPGPELGEEEEEQFLEKEFCTTYDSIHMERLNAMTKEELVKECLELEKKLEQRNRQEKEMPGKEGDKESSDAHSLGSSNEEFIDLNAVKSEDAV